MENLKIIFESDKDSLTIGSGTYYGIIDLDGFGSENTDFVFKDSQGNGSTMMNKRFTLREPMIHFDFHNNDLNVKDKVYALFSNAGKMTVITDCSKRSINYEVSQVLDKQTNLNSVIEFELQLKCPDAFFEDSEYIVSELTSWEGGFTCPTSFPFACRHRGNPNATVINNGHVPAEMIIEFKGAATNPMIQNRTTGKFVKVNTTLTADQTLIVDTNENKPTVKIQDGSTLTNAYNLISYLSDFGMNLSVGENILKYSSDNFEQINNVVVKYKKKYIAGW